MENGQKVDISLESGLDVKSSDMLVPVNSPLFQHNRQKYQGRYLPNSFRFEHDGWAAGKDVYNFKFISEEVPVTPDTGLTIKKKYLNENPTYIFEVYQKVTEDKQELKATCVFVADNKIINSSANDTVFEDNAILGNYLDKEFKIEYNPSTDKLNIFYRAYDSENRVGIGEFIPATNAYIADYKITDGYTLHADIKDINNSIKVDVSDVGNISDLVSDGEVLCSYIGYEDGIHTWRGNKYAVSVYRDTENNLVGSVTYGDDKSDTEIVKQDDGSYIIKFSMDFEYSDILNPAIDTVYTHFTSPSVTANMDTVTSSANSTKSAVDCWKVSVDNKQILYNNKQFNNSEFTDSGDFVVKQYLPMWFGIDTRKSVISEEYKYYDATGGVHECTKEEIYDNVKNSAVKYDDQKLSILSKSDTAYGDIYLAADPDKVYAANVEGGSVRLDKIRTVYMDGDFLSKEYSAEYSKVLTISKLKLDRFNIGSVSFRISTFYNNEGKVVSTSGHDLYLIFGGTSYSLDELMSAPKDEDGNIVDSNFTPVEVNVKTNYSIHDASGVLESQGIPVLIQGTGDYAIYQVSFSISGVSKIHLLPTTKSGKTLDQIYNFNDGKIEMSCVNAAICTRIFLKKNQKNTDKKSGEYITTSNIATLIGYEPIEDDDKDLVIQSKYAVHKLGTPNVLDTKLSFYVYAAMNTVATYLFHVDSMLLPENIINYYPAALLESDITLLNSSSIGMMIGEQLATVPVNSSGFSETGSTSYTYSLTVNFEAYANSIKIFQTDTKNNVVTDRSQDYAELYGSKFLSDMNNLLQSIKFTATSIQDAAFRRSIGFKSTQSLVYSIPNKLDISIKFNNVTNTIEIQNVKSLDYTVSDNQIDVSVDYSNNNLTINHKSHDMINYICETNIVEDTSKYKLLGIKDKVATFKIDDTMTFDFDYDTWQVTLNYSGRAITMSIKDLVIDKVFIAFSFEYMISFYIDAVIRGIYSQIGMTIDELADVTKFTYNNKQYSFILDDLLNAKSVIEYLCTPTDTEELEEIEIFKMSSDSEMQFLKQQWDTTINTENFWWLDKEHILVLTKDKFFIRKNTGELHDWNGNVFETIQTMKRVDYIHSDIVQYFCSSAKNDTAKFITISLTADKKILFSIFDFIKDTKQDITIPVVHVNLGTALNATTGRFNTYSNLNIDNLVSSAKFSATCIDGYIIIGMHYDNNFNQWALVIDSNGKYFTVQGYGFVGIDGSLTGGEIPYDFFNPDIGFNSIVQPLKNLNNTKSQVTSLNEVFNINTRIVGNDSQQWYITQNLNGIVSHLLFDSSIGKFTAVKLDIRSNYAVNYDSASYGSIVFGDYNFVIKNMKDLLPLEGGISTVWNAMLVAFGWPLMYYLDPKLSFMNYLQQTLGQAAYVHRNSTSVHQSKDMTKESKVSNNIDSQVDLTPKAVLEDEISFDVQSIKQVLKVENDPYVDMILLLASLGASALEFGFEQLSVNSKQNQQSTSDVGRRFSQIFLQNLNSMAAADMTIQSTNPTQTSEVTAIKTLDMFYSTTDKQQVQAGPGYVNHNFVAQCVAQSVTSTQVQASQHKILYIITQLTYFQIKITHDITEMIADRLVGTGQAQGGPAMFGYFGGSMAGTITTVSSGLTSIIILGVGYAMKLAAVTTGVGLELIPALLNSMGGGKLQSTVTANLSKHTYDIEGKHVYGNKSECFMWPCFDRTNTEVISAETVQVSTQNKAWQICIPTANRHHRKNKFAQQPAFTTRNVDLNLYTDFVGMVPYYIAMIKGIQYDFTLPQDTAYVIGTENFLSPTEFKNENIGESEPVFATAPFQDYIIDKKWQLSRTASVGMTTWVSCKDTKIIDGEPSNIVISDNFCGVASPYTAIEIKRGVDNKYLRPWAITPQALAINHTGFNCCYEGKVYHAFDGYGNRLVSWIGAPGMNKEHQTWQYTFLKNDRFKRSNKLPANEFLGNFKTDPIVAIKGDNNDKVFSLVTQPGENIGLIAGTIGEDKDIRRYSIPVFSEYVSTLPAAVKTISTAYLSVIDGVTSLTTDNRDLQSAYKAPVSIDFTIGKERYRFTDEYICSLKMEHGVTVVQEIVPCLGLTYLGSTPYDAYLYSQDTRQFYSFSGGSALQVVNMIERFRNISTGIYDFINQEVVMSCLATFLRLDSNVKDDADETDNIIVPRLKNNAFVGEIQPPCDTIFNTRSWFRTISLPCGITFQGPNRCSINKFTYAQYMLKQVTDNYGKWRRVSKEKYNPFRKYAAKYEYVDKQIGEQVKVNGWTHNPFLLVTSPLGVAENNDCLFEWEITFAWPVEMDELYGSDNFAVVMLQSETMTPGGKVIAQRPTHIYLTKELFTRTGNYGYYSFRYTGKCGAGNRERLHIWSDQYIAISNIQCESKVITQRRTEQLTQQVDVQHLREI